MTDHVKDHPGVPPGVVLVLRGLLASVLLFVLFQFVSLSAVVKSLATARLDFLAGAALLAIVNLGFQLLKWRYFVRLINPDSTTLEATGSFLFGLTLGTITPGQIGEFGGRAMSHASLSSGSIIGLTLVDRLQMICILGCGGAVSLVFFFGPGGTMDLLFTAVAITAFCAVFFNPGIISGIVSFFGPRFRSRPWVREFVAAVAAFRSRQLFASFALSFAFYLTICAQMYLLLNAFSNVPWRDAFLGFAAMMFFKALVPISIADLGVREASSVYFYSLLGIAPASALNASLLLFVVNVLIPSGLGLLFTPKSASK